LEKSGTAFPGIFTSWDKTIQYPARATRERPPATCAQANTEPGTGLARKHKRRAADVLRGHHLPPRYCHISHNRTAITGTDHGIPGVLARLTVASVAQTPAPKTVIPKPKRADEASARI